MTPDRATAASLFDLDGRVAIVTGASSGLGAAVGIDPGRARSPGRGGGPAQATG